MKQICSFLVILCISLSSYAQLKLLTTKETEVGSRRELAPRYLPNMQWKGNSAAFTYQTKDTIYQQSIKNSHPEKLISLYELNNMLKKSGTDTVRVLPYITWGNDKEFYFSSSKGFHTVDISKGKLVSFIKLPEQAANVTFNYAIQHVAYTIDNNLYITGTNGKPIAVSKDKNPDLVNGQTVSRNEFGIDGGIFWSPNGNYLAYYRKDNRNVGDYPLVDITAREGSLQNIKYPMAGMPSEHISVGIYHLKTETTQLIEKQDSLSEKYLTNLTWAPDEKSIYLQVLNREQNHMRLNQYRTSDGSLVKTLFEEKNDKYMEPLHPLLFLHKTPDRFIYQSRRDGYNHAYLYHTDGKLLKQITSGKWELTYVVSLDDQDNLWYMSCEASPIEEQAYCINIGSDKKTPLTQAPGTHMLTIHPTGKYWIDTYSNTSTPKVINLVSADRSIVRNLLTASNPLQSYAIPEMKIGTIKAADGVTDLYYRLIKPIGFDSTKHYPAIVYVYGGPHEQLITNRWLGGARLWDYLMAQKGYVIFTVDNRGSSNRGLAFENIIHRQCGVVEMQDQMEGVKFLQQLGFVDMKRLGVYGWSYGGFMTISLMTHYPDVFKVGVAGGPVIDWKYYEVMYGERYMDMPQENPEGYKNTSLIPMAAHLKGKLMIIHGGTDKTVVWQHSQLFIQACIENNVPVDYFVYPQAEHNVYGADRIHLMNKITQYFEDYLK